MWITRWEKEGNSDHHKSLGRPRKTTAIQEDIIRLFHENPTISTLEVGNKNGISRDNVRRRLKAAGLRNKVPARKPVPQRRHKDLRLDFANQCLNFDFKNVAFLDEKVFQSSTDGRVSLWRLNNTRYNEINVIENRRYHAEFGGGCHLQDQENCAK